MTCLCDESACGHGNPFTAYNFVHVLALHKHISGLLGSVLGYARDIAHLGQQEQIFGLMLSRCFKKTYPHFQNFISTTFNASDSQ